MQRINLRRHLDAETIRSQGFLSFAYTPEIISGMMESEPQIVVKEGDLLVGYALATTLEYGATCPLLQPLVDISRRLSFKDRPLRDLRYYLMGQVCIRSGHRGGGVFEALYQGHRQFLSPRHDCVVTEIAEDNKRSMAAHRRVGFQTIHELKDEANKEHWHVVAWDFQFH